MKPTGYHKEHDGNVPGALKYLQSAEFEKWNWCHRNTKRSTIISKITPLVRPIVLHVILTTETLRSGDTVSLSKNAVAPVLKYIIDKRF